MNTVTENPVVKVYSLITYFNFLVTRDHSENIHIN